jgi:hypothetical protein
MKITIMLFVSSLTLLVGICAAQSQGNAVVYDTATTMGPVANEINSAAFTTPSLNTLLSACPASPTPCHIVLDPSATAISIPLAVNTTTTAAITSTGSQTVNVSSTSGMVVGMPFWINGSDSNLERVLITSIGTGTVTGVFTLTHVTSSTITAGAFIGSTTQQIIVEDHGVTLNCTGTTYADCISVGDFGSLTCPAKSGATNGCNITASSTFVGSSLVTNAAHDGVSSTDFTLKGFNFQPNASASINHAELWVVAVEGKAIIEDTGGLCTANSLVGISLEDGPVTGSNNMINLFNNAWYGNGVAGTIPLQIISGAGSGQGSVITVVGFNTGDGKGGSGCASNAGCFIYIDGSNAGGAGTGTVAHFLQDITIIGAYVESTTGTSGNGIEAKNVKGLRIINAEFDGGATFSDCVLINSPYTSSIYTQDVEVNEWVHSSICTNTLVNSITSKTYTSAAQPILEYTYPGTPSQNPTGPVVDGNQTVNGMFVESLGGSITSATTIAPTNPIFHVSGSAAIESITAPTGFSGAAGCIQMIPSTGSTWTTGTTGNIALASTAVVGKTLTECWDGTSWYPTY